MKNLSYLIILILILCGCSSGAVPAAVSESAAAPSDNKSEPLSASFSGDVPSDTADLPYENEAFWAVYWDDEDVLQKRASDAFDTDIVCIFEAYFDEGYGLVCNEKTTQLLEKMRDDPRFEDRRFFLTVVNDVVGEDASEQKDTKVLYSVLQDPAGHASDIVSLAKKNGCDGVEIDYEKIRNDMELWELFLEFEKELIRLCKEDGLEVRIVLEPSTPAAELEFPEGAEYVVMCYNLFGYGTDPGPKADEEFLSKLVSDFEVLPGDTGYALANGGFDWDLTEGTVTSLTDLDLSGLIYGRDDVKRDPASSAFHFSFEKDGHEHEVWGADAETLDFWSRLIAKKAGRKVKISIWRL
ncbi:MAG: hypothetical protein IJS86_08150 [Lachnospiraceae bacterium]|nr:hypothetical protein [Lachnospiraceae bacterium]